MTEEVKVEKKTLSKEDDLFLYMLHDVVVGESEYCLDLGYNNEREWTVEERIDSLTKYLQSWKGKTVHDLIKDYGYDYFQSMISFESMYKDIYGDYEHRLYKLGDKFKAERLDGVFQIVQSDYNKEDEKCIYNVIDTNRFSILLDDGFYEINKMLEYMEKTYGKTTRVVS